MAQVLSRDTLPGLKKLLAEAARTDEQNAELVLLRYVELRPGIRAQLLSKRHQLVSGRRGTGKSTLLHVMRTDVRREGTRVAAVDMERFKGRAYPDVLIEILIALLAELKPPFVPRRSIASLSLRRRHRRIVARLRALLADPLAVERRFRRQSAKNGSIGGTARAGLAHRFADVTLAASTARSASQEDEESASFTLLKIEILQRLAGEIASLLSDLVKASGSDMSLVFIDDFNYTQLEDQPFVLDYLHQVCKSTGTWLKIGGVGSRLRPYQDGNPPTGMEPDQDIERLSMDVSLEEFLMAKDFLETVMDKLLASIDMDIKTLLTDDARNRIVLACGGAVPRDYMTLTSAAADFALERLKRGSKSLDEIRIYAEDIQEAARRRLSQKVDDLGRDAGGDAASLRERWEDVLEFSQQHIKSQFILVEQGNLTKEAWGQQIVQLESLRLLHKIRETTPNTPAWRGKRVVVYMLDLAAQAEKRIQREIPDFWKGQHELDKLRRAQWVYTPGWRATPSPAAPDGDDELVPAPAMEYDLLEELRTMEE